jgi:hypothetical protein
LNGYFAGGWADRLFKSIPGGVPKGIAYINSTASGHAFIENLSDFHLRRYQHRLQKLQSCTHLVLDFTMINEFVALPLLEAFYLQLINTCRTMNVKVWMTTPSVRLSSVPVGMGTTIAGQVAVLQPAFGLGAGTYKSQLIAWQNALLAAGTIAGILYHDASILDPSTGVFKVITPGTTYTDPGTYTQRVWTLVSGTATGSSSSTLTDSGQAWTTNQWSVYSFYVVSATGGSGTTYAVVASNTSTGLTIANSWSNGTPNSNSPYTIQPVLFDPFAGGNVHFSSFGAAMVAYGDQGALPVMASQASDAGQIVTGGNVK